MLVNYCLTTMAFYFRRLIVVVLLQEPRTHSFYVEKVALKSNFLLLVVCSVRRKVKADRSELYFCLGFYHAIFYPKV
jgi:hypothetical protein